MSLLIIVVILTVLGIVGFFLWKKMNCKNGWKSMGAFMDNATTRAIPNQLKDISIPASTATTDAAQTAAAVKSCGDQAKTAGYNVIGLQGGTQCWAGKDSKYDQYGKSSSTNSLGDTLVNQVYKMC